MTVFKPNKPAKIIKEGKTYRTPLLPGFEMPLGEILAVADQWQQPEL